MLLLDVKSLRDGYVIAGPVRHPARPEVELLRPGVALEPRMIAELARLGVPSAWVHWPSLDFLDARLARGAESLRTDVLVALRQDFEKAQSLTVGPGQYLRYRRLIARLILELAGAEHGGAGACSADLFGHGREGFAHAANVAYLALTLGLRLEDYIVRQRRSAAREQARDLTNLGVGAMLHDIGKLEEDAGDQHEPLDSAPTPAYQKHCVAGYRMLRGRIAPTARTAVLHHHQRYDGRGFPAVTHMVEGRRGSRPLHGCRIHVFARIVHACDLFDHLGRDANGRPRPMVAALHDVLRPDILCRLDPHVVRALLVHVPPFGLGADLTLSDGSRVAVVGLNRARPCRPIVRVLDEGARAVDVDLARREDLHVARCLGVDVTPWLFDLPPAIGKADAWREYCERVANGGAPVGG